MTFRQRTARGARGLGYHQSRPRWHNTQLCSNRLVTEAGPCPAEGTAGLHERLVVPGRTQFPRESARCAVLGRCVNTFRHWAPNPPASGEAASRQDSPPFHTVDAGVVGVSARRGSLATGQCATEHASCRPGIQPGPTIGGNRVSARSSANPHRKLSSSASGLLRQWAWCVPFACGPQRYVRRQTGSAGNRRHCARQRVALSSAAAVCTTVVMDERLVVSAIESEQVLVRGTNRKVEIGGWRDNSQGR